jgi:hypothetical protein
MNRRILRALALAIAIGLPSMTASANEYDEDALGKKVANSDVVAIGQVTSTSQSNCLKTNSSWSSTRERGHL